MSGVDALGGSSSASLFDSGAMECVDTHVNILPKDDADASS